MAYLIGMILGNGEVQVTATDTTVIIDIPYKNLRTDDDKDVSVYVLASIVNIKSIVEPLIDETLVVSDQEHSTKLSFTKKNSSYIITEILRFIDGGKHHSTMRMNPDLFDITLDEKRSLLKGIADVTGYIRKSNYFIKKGQHRVYIEVPRNWYMVIDIANMLKDVDVPVQTIDFGHPNFRDSNLEKFNEGKPYYWKKEHQIKIFANEFIPIGFNIKHKQQQLEKYSQETLCHLSPGQTHKYYWQKTIRRKERPIHPCENDPSLPVEIRGIHFESWCFIANLLGYGE